MYDKMTFSSLLWLFVSSTLIRPHAHTLSLFGSRWHFYFALCCARKPISECTWVTPSLPLSGSNSVQVDFPPQWLLRTLCSPNLLSVPPAGLNKTTHVLPTEKVPKRVLFKLQKQGEKGRAKATLLLSVCSRCNSLQPDPLRKLSLFSLPLSGP